MSANEIQTEIARLERRVRIAEIQNATRITLELLSAQISDLKQALARTERPALVAA